MDAQKVQRLYGHSRQERWRVCVRVVSVCLSVRQGSVRTELEQRSADERLCSDRLRLSRDPDDSVLASLNEGLHAHNVAALGKDVINEYYRLAVVARDGKGQVIGGAWGEVYWDWLHIDTLWVNASHRGEGLGACCMRELGTACRRDGV